MQKEAVWVCPFGFEREELEMKKKSGNSEFVPCEKLGERRHHHRGKSSENLRDKVSILSALEVEFGQTVLDAGCGNGYMSKEFSK